MVFIIADTREIPQLLICTDDMLYLPLQRDAAFFQRQTGIEGGNEAAFVIHCPSPINNSIFDFSSVRIMGPSVAFRHYVHMADYARGLFSLSKIDFTCPIIEIYAFKFLFLSQSHSKIKGLPGPDSKWRVFLRWSVN